MNRSSEKLYKENAEFLKLLTKFIGENHELKKENENLKNKLMENVRYNKESIR